MPPNARSRPHRSDSHVEIRARTEGRLSSATSRTGSTSKKATAVYPRRRPAPRRAGAGAGRAEKREASLRQAQQLLTRYEQLKNSTPSAATTSTTPACSATSPPPPSSRRKRVDRAAITLAYTRIDSPVTGRVGHSRFHVGSLVGPSSGVLVDIVQLDPIRVSFAWMKPRFSAKPASMPISTR
jgi:multidrug resistance efflux pump